MEPFSDDPRWVMCEMCDEWVGSLRLTEHMDGHGYDLRDEIANAEVVDLTGEPT